MVDLAGRRVGPWADRARILHTDGSLPLPLPDGSAERFVAAYVLDLLEPDYARRVIEYAHRVPIPGGRLCLASLTWGRSRSGAIVTAAWHGVWRRAPRLVGGYRPIWLLPLIPERSWAVQDDTMVQSWGVSSEVVIASRSEEH